MTRKNKERLVAFHFAQMLENLQLLKHSSWRMDDVMQVHLINNLVLQ